MKEWEKEERRLARRRGGVRQPGSGSGWRRRNDVREATILWEQKTTGNRQYTIKEDDWENLRKNALLEGLIPMLHITLGAKKRRLIVLEEGDFPDAENGSTQRSAPPEGHVPD